VVGTIPEPELKTISAGSFVMGSKAGGKNEHPTHRVDLDTFAIAVSPVSRAEYDLFLRQTGRTPPPYWDDPRFEHPQQPLVAPSWIDADDYCRWLSQLTGRPYRLPTEAEREKAARGGVEGQSYPWGEGFPEWLDPHYRGDDVEKPDLVGNGSPNGYGLYNMGDLVHEWCSDWYDAEYYAVSPAENPPGPATGRRRASRGGSWRHHVKVTRCAARSSIPPDRHFADYGFRVAVSV